MKRNNPKTGRPFKRGDKREDGFVFKEYYLGKMKQDGFFKEKWYSPESYFRVCVRNKFKDSTRTRNRQPGFEKLENDLSTDYLISIFPEDRSFSSNECLAINSSTVFCGIILIIF